MTQNPPRLTQNQRAVLFQASLGKTQAEIADALGLSLGTIRAHLYIARRGGRDLSPMQEAVVYGASRGLSNQEIADELGLSIHTVRAHKRAAMKTLGRDEYRRRIYRNAPAEGGTTSAAQSQSASFPDAGDCADFAGGKEPGNYMGSEQ